MSPLILSTDADDPYATEVAGVGVLGGNGRGGFTAERVAQSLPELQGEDGEPLTGKKLEEALRAFAKDRGLHVRSQKTVDEQALREEGGAFPAGPTIEELAGQAAERDRAQVEAHAETPEAGPLSPEQLPPQETATHPETPEA